MVLVIIIKDTGESYLGGGLGDNEELDSEVETTNECLDYFEVIMV